MATWVHQMAPGSSPHTRGLPVGSLPRHHLERIIPAHAGFTPSPRRRPRRHQDHPRTRGVYWRRLVKANFVAGSSPHTRGLRSLYRGQPGRLRIIPAHAGFTPDPPGDVAAVADHPRTRGVYDSAGVPGTVAEGSSPHTRGLPYQGADGCTGVRIIPAHAGFTCLPARSWTRRRDHPRTRGVYPMSAAKSPTWAGSSPHMRGLLPRATVAVPPSGIIPAHAGFTPCAEHVRGVHRDHPRTRGVYSPPSRSPACSAGSSPHTRGLRGRRGSRSSRVRIIPAHAGFTADLARLPPEQPDHPRTRGVYSRPGTYTTPSQGSSPHTRGLRLRAAPTHPVLRIIPAHAGFTRQRRTVPQGGRDHPRTRGVYREGHPRPTPGRGSSPHTRGLRRHGRGADRLERIIPAHAGFTCAARPRTCPPRDHPRTRGVYVVEDGRQIAHMGSSPHTRGLLSVKVVPDLSEGSSPHTRGLLRLLHGVVVRDGIIPAHAGFTPAPSGSGGPCWDHPRTRGVYLHDEDGGWSVMGSSPHTRGLLLDVLHGVPEVRIIPAHAGFT